MPLAEVAPVSPCNEVSSGYEVEAVLHWGSMEEGKGRVNHFSPCSKVLFQKVNGGEWRGMGVNPYLFSQKL
jgi:hypothetical protein